MLCRNAALPDRIVFELPVFIYQSESSRSEPLTASLNDHIFFVALRPNAGHGLLILEISRSHTTTHHIR